MIKLKFSNPIIKLNDKETIMRIECQLCIENIIIKDKIFNHKITLKKNDVYDLNKAKDILQAIIEQKAYVWAKKIIDREIEKEKCILDTMFTFSEKADHIIKHDETYINQLMK